VLFRSMGPKQNHAPPSARVAQLLLFALTVGVLNQQRVGLLLLDDNRATIADNDVPQEREDREKFVPQKAGTAIQEPTDRIQQECRLECSLFLESYNDVNGSDGVKVEPLVGIVTAFSSNHLYESLGMLQSLIDVNYTGPLSIYLMRKPGEIFDDSVTTLCQEISKSKLCAEVIEYEVKEDFGTYCFKPRIVSDVLIHHKMQVLMWVDASARVQLNPQVWAANMVRDKVDFAGYHDPFGVTENTHDATFRFLNISRTKYKHKYGILGTFFLVRIYPRIMFHVLQPWIDCGSRACETCMTPLGTAKQFEKHYIIEGPPSVTFKTHRHDQAVLTLLLYDWKYNHRGRVSLEDESEKYIAIQELKSGDEIVPLELNST